MSRNHGVALGFALAFLMLAPGVALAGYINYPTFKRTGGLELNGDAATTVGARCA
jgi:hypothetical protein